MAIQIDKLLDLAVQKGASDLHLTVGLPPVLRLNGRLRQVSSEPLTPEDTVSLMRALTSERSQQELHEQGGADFGFSFGDKGRFRVSIFKHKGTVGIALRLIPRKLYSLEELELPDAVREICLQTRGLVLVTGPTGSGKTTTLASMIEFINAEVDRHILTIEDPIEYEHPHKRSIVTQREVGVDVGGFHEALRRGLRQDPDVILLGEMRDLETTSAAITAAETGHLVFATVHTVGAAETVHRLVDAFPQAQQDQVRTQLSTALRCVISQALLAEVSRDSPGTVVGRVAAFEVLVVTPAVAHLIRENKIHRIDNEIQTGTKHGMRLLDDHLLDLFKRGRIRYQDMMERARNAAELQKRVKAEGHAAVSARRASAG